MRFIDIEEPARILLSDALALLSSLKPFFKKQGVELVFLHGSLAKDAMKALSDVDVAVLFGQKSVSYKKISAVYQKLTKLLNREDIDVMALNHASPLARMQVLCGGRVIYCHNQKVLKQFRLATIQRYLATQQLRSSFNRYMETAILGK